MAKPKKGDLIECNFAFGKWYVGYVIDAKRGKAPLFYSKEADFDEEGHDGVDGDRSRHTMGTEFGHWFLHDCDEGCEWRRCEHSSENGGKNPVVDI